MGQERKARWSPEECAAAPLTIEEAHAFIASCTWTFAKTMPEYPHEYIVRRKVDNDKFVGLVKLIRAAGEKRRWRRYKHVYLDLDGWQYWTMGAPVEITIIINRSQLGDPRTDGTPL